MNDRGLLSIETKIVHHRRVKLPEGNTPLVSPIHQSVKYTPANMSQLKIILSKRKQGFLYSRVSNPTVRELEQLLAELQGRDDAIATASGIGALTAVAMTFLKAGDRVVIFTESYKPTRFLLGTILKRFGIDTHQISRDDYQEFEALCKSTNPPKIVFLESPTNPTLRIHDLAWIAKTANDVGCISVLDNTFAGLLAHGEFEIDLYVHSLTKQASGHSDAMGGVIIGREDLINKVFPVAMTLGGCLDPNSAWLILRGMKTFALRTRESSKNACELANWLLSQTWAEKVRYPSLKSHPDYTLWQKQNKNDGGSVITFDLNLPEDKIDAFFDSLNIFSVTPSLGCVESLAVPCLMLFADDLPTETAQRAGISAKTIRLAIGIESPEDLKGDLINAVTAASIHGNSHGVR